MLAIEGLHQDAVRLIRAAEDQIVEAEAAALLLARSNGRPQLGRQLDQSVNISLIRVVLDHDRDR